MKGEDGYKKIFKMNHKLKNCFGKSVCCVRGKERRRKGKNEKKKNQKSFCFCKNYIINGLDKIGKIINN